MGQTAVGATPEASSSLISTSNSAVMWETSLAGDLRPRRRFFDESHLRLTNVTWQSSVQGNWPASKPTMNKRVRENVEMNDAELKHQARALLVQSDGGNLRWRSKADELTIALKPLSHFEPVKTRDRHWKCKWLTKISAMMLFFLQSKVLHARSVSCVSIKHNHCSTSTSLHRDYREETGKSFPRY